MKNEIFFKIEALEKKMQQLITENFDFSQKIANFENILMSNADRVKELEQEIERLKIENEQLKIGKAFVGNKEDNKEAKKKIDNLIKEINACITTLKE